MMEQAITYVYSEESRISEGEAFPYLSEEEPRYIIIRGTSVLVANESGCNPFYFEPKFNTLVVVGKANQNENNTSGAETQSKPNTQGLEQNNGTIAANVEQTPAQKENTSIPGKESKSTPGFEIVCVVVSILGVFLYRRE